MDKTNVPPASFVPRVGLPYPVGRLVSGRVVSRLNAALYQIDLSGRLYTAEISSEKHRKAFAPGDPVTVKVVSKRGVKAVLQIVEPEYPDIGSPTHSDLSKLARAAGWPETAAAVALVSALVSRRLPLRSELADTLYLRLKSMELPTVADAEKLLIDFFEPKS